MEEIKLSPEEVEHVKGIIAQANEEMAQVATGIGRHGANLGTAYQGSGTAVGVQTYEDLGRAGQALANALNGLSQDLGLTAMTGRETDDTARAALQGVVAPNVSGDPSIAAQI
ncbi:WXG100 family type VII secretion target [Streptomyces profundus]|uniref:WXG100 family type VII secretion target n=1 Tax=Streptomyces profundus TaxID=2867410 RepID=UPI001D15FEEF|nr:hypothetical protein [Streptomyces sp. MA3_2.13]UED83390.1 hypothetical protein K4G22_03530 [Streptomyces sp. MA3_2.13]